MSDLILFALNIAAAILVVVTWRVLNMERKMTRLADKDEKVSAMIAILSTQLRSPLTTISWYSELMLGQDFGKLKISQLEAMDKIQRGAATGQDIVNRLLEFSKTDRGEMMYKKSSLDIGSVIQQVLDAMKNDIMRYKVNIIFDQKTSSHLVFADSLVVHTVLLAVISNAIMYSNEEESVVIDVKQLETNVMITVKDTGMGIAEFDKHKMFTKFFRGENAQLKVPSGNGLSLYMAQSFLKDTGGSISFASHKDVQTTFTIMFPNCEMGGQE